MFRPNRRRVLLYWSEADGRAELLPALMAALAAGGWSPRVGDGFVAWDVAVRRGPWVVRVSTLTEDHFTADLHGRLTRVRVAAAMPGVAGPVRRVVDGVAVAQGFVPVGRVRDAAAMATVTLVVAAVGLNLLQVCAFVVSADGVTAVRPAGLGRLAVLALALTIARVVRVLVPAPAVAVRGVTLAILFGTMLVMSVRLTAVSVAVGVPLVWAVRRGHVALGREPSGADAARFTAALNLVEPFGPEITALITFCHRARLAVQAVLRRHHRMTFALLILVAMAAGTAAVLHFGSRTGLPLSPLAIFLAWPAMLYIPSPATPSDAIPSERVCENPRFRVVYRPRQGCLTRRT